MSSLSIQQAMDLAAAHHQAGRLAQAESIYRAILSQKPDYPDALHMLGVLAQQAGQAQAAVELIRRAIALEKTCAQYHYNLGRALMELALWDEAIAAYQQALILSPGYLRAWNNLGAAMHQRGRLDEAIACFGEALKLRPNFPDALYNLGKTLQAKRDWNGAIACYRQLLGHRADYIPAYNDLGIVLCEVGQIDEAVNVLAEAVSRRPDYSEAHNNRANALLAQGAVSSAILSYQQAVELNPANAGAASNRLFALHFHPSYDAPAILRECREWDKRYAAPLAPSVATWQNDRSPDRKLRIGYLSPDFCAHCQAMFTLPLLSGHNHEQVEIFCYADVQYPDAITNKLRLLADAWRPITGMSDQNVAELIRADGIDILIDLTMYMAGGRPLVMARKPAPVQGAWLAYPGTTGLAAVDYRLTDPYLDPPGQFDECYSEQSIRLPHTFWCYDANVLGETPPVVELPALKNGFITFGCLNNFCKVSEGTLALWAEVLLRVQRSRLRLLAPTGDARQWVLKQLDRRGVKANRVDFVARRARPQYMAEFNRIDVGLDTSPYNGHTTSLDSLWMGVPVVTRVGRTVVGRAGLSQLTNLNLTELVGYTDEQFIKIAVELAENLPRLTELRRTLRDRMTASPLTDSLRFAGDMESAYREMWKAWCRRSAG
jgi:predicted O-linked N-acetylglucosamine transferase (SPINDLY family)